MAKRLSCSPNENTKSTETQSWGQMQNYERLLKRWYDDTRESAERMELLERYGASTRSQLTDKP